MTITRDSKHTVVMRTVCEKCGTEGYIFPDQLARDEQYGIGSHYFSKCCAGREAGEKRSMCKYFISPDRAHRLQTIRSRGNTLSAEEKYQF